MLNMNPINRILIQTLMCLSVLALTACVTDTPVDSEDQALTDSMGQMAQVAERNGDYRSAVIQYRKLVTRLPDDQVIALAYARNLRYAGEASAAVSVIQSSIGKFGEKPALITEYGKALIAAGRSKEGLVQLTRAAKVTPDDWQIHSALGIAYDLSANPQMASKSYQRALELSPDNPEIFNNMALSEALAGNIDKAIEILKKLTSQNRGAAQFRQNLAFFYGITGDMEKAESLAKMDLNDAAVRNNIQLYSKFNNNR